MSPQGSEPGSVLRRDNNESGSSHSGDSKTRLTEGEIESRLAQHTQMVNASCQSFLVLADKFETDVLNWLGKTSQNLGFKTFHINLYKARHTKLSNNLIQRCYRHIDGFLPSG